MKTAKCQWCEKALINEGAGKPKRFCCHAHRQSFWNALRCVGYERFAAGEVTVKQLREQYGAKAS